MSDKKFEFLNEIKAISKNFSDQQKQYKKLKKETGKSFKKELQHIFTQFFAITPQVKAISWPQYDLIEVFFLNFIPKESFDYLNGYDIHVNEGFAVSAYNAEIIQDFSSEQIQLITNIENIICNNDTLVEDVFGHDVIVIATRKGIKKLLI